MTSPTARSLKLLRASGFVADVAERYLHHVRRKRDLLGFADIVAVRRGVSGCLAIQATTRAHVSERLTRCKARAELAVWLAAGNAFEVWGWFKRGDRWTVHRVAVHAQDLREVVLTLSPIRRRRKAERGLFDQETT